MDACLSLYYRNPKRSCSSYFKHSTPLLLLGRFQVQTHFEYLKIKSDAHPRVWTVPLLWGCHTLGDSEFRFPALSWIIFSLFCLGMILKSAFPGSFLLCECHWSSPELCACSQVTQVSVEFDSEEKSLAVKRLTLCSFFCKLADRRQRSAELSVHPEPTAYITSSFASFFPNWVYRFCCLDYAWVKVSVENGLDISSWNKPKSSHGGPHL